MEKCLTCPHWEQKTKYENVSNTGRCKGLRASPLLDFYSYGDGGLDYIETDENFGCVEHPKNQE